MDNDPQVETEVIWYIRLLGCIRLLGQVHFQSVSKAGVTVVRWKSAKLLSSIRARKQILKKYCELPSVSVYNRSISSEEEITEELV